MKDLIKEVTGREASYYVDDYQEEFANEYELVKKIKKSLSKDEFELLLRMTYEEEWELYRLVKYWRDKNE